MLDQSLSTIMQECIREHVKDIMNFVEFLLYN